MHACSHTYMSDCMHTHIYACLLAYTHTYTHAKADIVVLPIPLHPQAFPTRSTIVFLGSSSAPNPIQIEPVGLIWGGLGRGGGDRQVQDVFRFDDFGDGGGRQEQNHILSLGKAWGGWRSQVTMFVHVEPPVP
jgi:hypothetical protein